MYRVIDCFTNEHNHLLVAVAALICIVGTTLAAQLLRRMKQAQGKRQQFQIFLGSLICGATIWSTHFIAMLAYEPGFPHGYAPGLTATSLAVAVVGILAAVSVLAFARTPVAYLAGGSVFGVTVSAMHYTGMSAYLVPGYLVWHPGYVVASILLGAALGAAAFHRILHPVTRYCWLGGAVFMTLSICAMHFTGMAAFSVELSPLQTVPPKVMSDGLLAIAVFGVTAVIFFTGFVGMSIELQLEREARDEIKAVATHDALTKLPNRLSLLQKLTALGPSLEVDRTLRVAVLTIDLNMFKEVNDLHGHAAGDAVIAEIARRLMSGCGENEFVARTGGDEFVAVKVKFRRLEEVKALAERLHAAIIEPIEVDDLSLIVGASIGIATSVDDGRDVDLLLQKSDLAMYRAKADSGLDVCFFDVEMGQQNRERLLMINDLRQAAAKDQLELVYQLQNDVVSMAPRSFEVLLRWNHPTRGRVSPVDFIPLAEETGLIREIGLWVLRTACLEAASWSTTFGIAVNVAPKQLAQPSFLEHLSDILIESSLAPERLELEITEASIIDDQTYTLDVMHKIKAMGIRIAMDDFGTGYSSLATLQAFPFDKIKIDRSFIQDVHIDAQRAAIVRSTLLLGDALQIPVLAEGVEVDSELDFLRKEKCQYVQGFYFGKPLTLDEVREVIQGQREDKAS